jgi:hypothetical protein
MGQLNYQNNRNHMSPDIYPGDSSGVNNGQRMDNE